MDWYQIIHNATLPDNVPILLLVGLLAVYLTIAFKQMRANDRLITQLEADPALAKTHHRRHHPYHPAWDKTVHTWPYLLRIELLASLIVLAILVLWGVWLDAPLEAPANPSLTMNPSKAPWYFLGLQELLVYFDPWIAGVILPHVILGGLMFIPYLDTSPLGNGYYTWKQRKFAIGGYLVGFLVLWVGMAVIGVFIRGPGWMWFWPGETWDHHRVVHEVNVDLHQLFGMTDPWVYGIFGGVVVFGFMAVTMGICDVLIRKLKPDLFHRMNMVQYIHLLLFLMLAAAVPVKMILKLVFSIKYVWVTPWFNV